MFLFFGGKYRNILLGHVIRVHLTLGETVKLFSKVVERFCMPISTVWGIPVLPHPHQHLLLVFKISTAQVLKSDRFQILVLLLANPVTVDELSVLIESSFQSHFKNETPNTFFMKLL